MPKVLSIHSYRGGTGKSNLAANLAVSLARSGLSVGIVDTDIQSPGIHVLFGMRDEDIHGSLNDYLWGRKPIVEAAHEISGKLREEQGFDGAGKIYLVPSSMNAGEIARILREGYDVGRLNDGFQDLIRDLAIDALLIDTHPGLNEETLLSIAISDSLALILRPDQQDFLGSAVTVEVARKLNVPSMGLVINKAPASLDFEALARHAEETFAAPVLGVLPQNDEMMMLGSAGILCLSHPDHEWSKKVGVIAGRMMAMGD